MIVSIHTPTQGVTALLDMMDWILKVTFQSTHPRRVWRSVPAQTRQPSVFQSTHPRRVWRCRRWLFFRTGCFNPHTHAGCDIGCSAPVGRIHVSIHTPTQGVTSCGPDGRQPAPEFQSTHPRRVWLMVMALAVGIGKFQSTHPRRVWLYI